ncbi:MAG: DPP IV N-terminal domain-containing protein [Proteobacteria bacterium]|nr:DPP IV N-terminal domain-containing protein [Pseudomonadota bacterium]
MIRPALLSLLLLAGCAATGAPDRSAAVAGGSAPPLTPERVFGDPDIAGPVARGVALSPDGARVTFLRPKPENREVLDLWAADTAGGEPYRLIDAAALSSGAALTEAEIARRERQRIAQRGVVEYHWDDQGRFILVPLDGDLWLHEQAGRRTRRLTETPGDEIDSKVSPRGRFVSYVRDQNLYIRPVDGGRERALTTGGKGTLSWAVAEFINQEEFNRFTGYWWSPDESRIALTRVDESGVDVIPRSEISAEGVTTTVEQRYPRAGRPNAVVELYVQQVANGRRVKVDLGPNPDIYLVRVDWSKDGRTLYAQRLNRAQTRLDLLAVDPATGRSRVVLSETLPQWVDVTDDFKPLADGSFLWTSEVSGYKHIQHRAADGRLLRTVTSGEWPVDAILAVDEPRRRVFFAASKDTPIERRVYAVSYAQPGEPEALTPGRRWSGAEFARSGKAFTATWSDPTTPPRTGLYAADGSLLRWIEENPVNAAHPWAPWAGAFPDPQYGQLVAADGQRLQYMLLKPRGFDPNLRYPAIVNVYGGPASQLVRQAWIRPEYRLWQEAGYVVYVLDNRGTPNRSVAFERAIHRGFGTVEVDDQLLGARFLQTLSYVDPARVGVYGWSQGGFMTLMMMTAPNSPFAAGMAGASPTEWGLYDTAYTERYMLTPQANRAGYAASDVIPRLDRIRPDSLLLMHGMADDNVLLSNTTRVMGALQARSTPFELMLYPGQRHGIRGKALQLHQWRTWSDFFDRRLQPGAAAPASR